MPPVTVYSKPGCQPCRLTKKALDNKGIKFTEIDISEDADALAYVSSLGALSAPVVVVGEQDDYWFGFKPEKISALG